jgi:hypothetical protein
MSETGKQRAGRSIAVGTNPGGSTRESGFISHISPKTSEIWGHPQLWLGESFNGCSFHTTYFEL